MHHHKYSLTELEYDLHLNVIYIPLKDHLEEEEEETANDSKKVEKIKYNKMDANQDGVIRHEIDN